MHSHTSGGRWFDFEARVWHTGVDDALSTGQQSFARGLVTRVRVQAKRVQRSDFGQSDGSGHIDIDLPQLAELPVPRHPNCKEVEAEASKHVIAEAQLCGMFARKMR